MSGRLIVFKVGSSTLVDEAGELDLGFVASMCAQIAELRRRGDRVVLVSSGAAAVGRSLLGFDARPSDIPTLQACAAAGQAKLIERYAEVLADDGLSCAQVLLTRGDVVDRTGYLNARTTFERLLELGVVPIVNENDTVSVREFSFGDNDMLGAIVASLIDADLYVILSDIDGLYTANPDSDPSASLIERVERVDARIGMAAAPAQLWYGRHGHQGARRPCDDRRGHPHGNLPWQGTPRARRRRRRPWAPHPLRGRWRGRPRAGPQALDWPRGPLPGLGHGRRRCGSRARARGGRRCFPWASPRSRASLARATP